LKNKEQLDTMAGMLDSAASEVRTISHQMMPKELEQFGLLPAIESLLSNNLGITGKNFEFNHFGFNSRLPQQIELNLFRITQELVSNTIKHADATQLNVQLLKRGDVVVLIFEDNGKGFEVLENANFGIGLLNVESRVKSINATLDIESELGKGTTIRIRTPLNE
jgi:signal transduction histidine kinase